MSDTAHKSWYATDQGEPITFPEASAHFSTTITVTHEQFQNLIECAGRGCRAWVDEFRITRLDFRIREWRTVPGKAYNGPCYYSFHWHTITPRKLAAVIARVCKGEEFNYLEAASAGDIRNIWLAPFPDDMSFDDDIANNLVQLVAFGELRYG